MPINYSCPRCGQQFSAAEQFAGKTSRCAGCGKSVTIPVASGSSMGGAGPRMRMRFGMRTVFVVAGTLLVLFFCGGLLMVPPMLASRQAMRRMQSTNHLKQLGLAVHLYHDAFGCLPPAVVKDATGKPLYSGRVLLLPFLERQSLYEAFDKTQAWDSPTNRPQTRQAPSMFVDPAANGKIAGQTDYLFVVGKGTIFEPPAEGSTFSNITDGLSNTICLVEIAASGINWAEPRDLDFSQPLALPPGNHPKVNLSLNFDGSTRPIPNRLSDQVVHALATCKGGEPIGDF